MTIQCSGSTIQTVHYCTFCRVSISCSIREIIPYLIVYFEEGCLSFVPPARGVRVEFAHEFDHALGDDLPHVLVARPHVLTLPPVRPIQRLPLLQQVGRVLETPLTGQPLNVLKVPENTRIKLYITLVEENIRQDILFLNWFLEALHTYLRLCLGIWMKGCSGEDWGC